MKSLTSTIVAASLGALQLLHAQEQSAKFPPPPQFPLKLRAPQNASWTVTITGRKDVKEGNGDTGESADEQRSIVKSFPIYHEVAQGETGWQMWLFAGSTTYRFIKSPSDSKWSRVQDTYYNDIPRYDHSDFSEAEWIDKSNFRDVRMLDERPVYYFSLKSDTPIVRTEKNNVALSDDEKSLVHYSAYAWIDAKTLLPVKVESGDKVRTYAFGEPPSSRLSPPEEVLADLKQWVELNRRLSR